MVSPPPFSFSFQKSLIFQPGWIFLKQNIFIMSHPCSNICNSCSLTKWKSPNSSASLRSCDGMTPPYWSFISFHSSSLPAKPNYSLFSVFLLLCLYVVPFAWNAHLYNYRSNLQSETISSWWQHGVVEWHENIYQKTWLRVLDLSATNYVIQEVLILKICKMRNISLTRLLWNAL